MLVGPLPAWETAMLAESGQRPTDAELAILNVIWDRDEATVREVHEVLAGASERGYTTTLKLMQLMHEKGLLSREAAGRQHVYRTAINREETQRLLVNDLADRAFGGSAASLVMRALTDEPASHEELERIRRMLDQLDQEAGS